MADKPQNTPAEELPEAVLESEQPSGAEAYFEKNKGKLIALIGLVIIGSAAYIVLTNISKEKDREAANAFTNANTTEQFRQVSIDFQGTVAGGNALLMKADRESKEQNSKAAVSTLTEFVSSYPDHPRYAQGLFALAEHAQDEGKTDEAKRRFDEIVNSQSATELAPLALMRLGDIAMAAKNYDEARSIYNSVMPRFPANPLIQKITQKIALLDLESPPPDLKKPEPPAPKSTTPPAQEKAPANTQEKPAPKTRPPATKEKKANPKPAAESTPKPKAKGPKKSAAPAPDTSKPTPPEPAPAGNN